MKYFKNKTLREHLWRANPNCHYCDTPTVPPEQCPKSKTPPDNMATLDHVYTRFDEERKEGQNRYVVNLACNKCNKDLGREREKQVPIEELRARSSHKLTPIKKLSKLGKWSNWLDSPEGDASIEKFVEELHTKKEALNHKLQQLHNALKTPKRFDKHISNVVAGVLHKIKKCEHESGGYEINDKGEHCEISPTESFDILFEYFRAYGSDANIDDEDFLSEQYELNGYTMKLYQGQGAFYRLYKVTELLVQI